MAYNDIDVILYKILRYISECMKAGVPIDFEQLQAKSHYLSIPESYARQVLHIAVTNGLIEGLRRIDTKDFNGYVQNGEIILTLAGNDYLRDNNGMRKAREFLGETFESLLYGIVQLTIEKMC